MNNSIEQMIESDMELLDSNHQNDIHNLILEVSRHQIISNQIKSAGRSAPASVLLMTYKLRPIPDHYSILQYFGYILSV